MARNKIKYLLGQQFYHVITSLSSKELNFPGDGKAGLWTLRSVVGIPRQHLVSLQDETFYQICPTVDSVEVECCSKFTPPYMYYPGKVKIFDIKHRNRSVLVTFKFSRATLPGMVGGCFVPLLASSCKDPPVISSGVLIVVPS